MNEQITREAMKKEAERRIKMLNLHPNAVQDFIEEGRLNRSDRTRIVSPFGKHMIGALFWLNVMTCCMFPDTATNGKLTGWTFKMVSLSCMSAMRQLRIYLNLAISASKPLAAVSSARCRKGLTP